MTRTGSRASFIWWVTIGSAELVIAIALLAFGYWWTILGTLPATALCAYFARQAWERRS